MRPARESPANENIDGRQADRADDLTHSLSDRASFRLDARAAEENPVRVLLLLQRLAGGGAERVAINLVNHCDPRRVDVRMGLLRREGQLLQELDPISVVSPAGHRRTLAEIIAAPAGVVRMIRMIEPDVVMSFGMGVDVLTWLALKSMRGKRPLWLGRYDSNPAAEIGNLKVGRLGVSAVTAALNVVHDSMNGIVAVSNGLAKAADHEKRKNVAATRVISNPVEVTRIRSLAEDGSSVSAPRPFILTAGRLVQQKGHDLLIKAFADTPSACGMDLVILGDGPLRPALVAQAAALGVADRVRLIGFQANPWAWMARSRLFVLPSRWEGFGNVVAEALACGAPTLVTDCDYGPQEQIAHGVSGWVVATENAPALASAMDMLLSKRALRTRLALNGMIRANDFDAAKIADAYTRLFVEIASRITLAEKGSPQSLRSKPRGPARTGNIDYAALQKGRLKDCYLNGAEPYSHEHTQCPLPGGQLATKIGPLRTFVNHLMMTRDEPPAASRDHAHAELGG